MAAAGLLACSPANREDPPAQADAGGPAEELVTTLQVQVSDDAAHLALHVTNPLPDDVELSFSTGQRFEFVVLDEGGAEVWRWSADRAFTQALGTERLQAGETITWEAEWPHEGRAGTYQAVGRLTATDANIEERASFVLPGRGG